MLYDQCKYSSKSDYQKLGPKSRFFSSVKQYLNWQTEKLLPKQCIKKIVCKQAPSTFLSIS